MAANGVDEGSRLWAVPRAARYKDFSNIIWMSGNDYQAWGPANDPYVTAVAQGIRDTDPAALQTVELNYLTSGSLDDPTWAPLIDLNAVLHIRPHLHAGAQGLQPRATSCPTFMVEASYEDEHNAGTTRGNAAATPPAGVLDAAERRHGPALREPIHLAVPCPQRDADGELRRRLEGRSSHAGRDADGERHGAVLARGRGTTLVPDQDHTVVTSGLRNVRRRRLRDGRSHARRQARHGVRALGPHDHGRPEHVQRPGHRALVRPDERDVYRPSAARPFANSRQPQLTPREPTRRHRRLGARCSKHRSVSRCVDFGAPGAMT